MGEFAEKETVYVYGLRDLERVVTGKRCIVEIFVITAKAEPSLGVPCSHGLFKVAEGDARAGRDPGTRLTQKGDAKIDCLRTKDGHWGGVLGGRDLDETQQMGILYGPEGWDIA